MSAPAKSTSVQHTCMINDDHLPVDQQSLKLANRCFAGTGGVSCNNRSAGFVPAYLNTSSGVAVSSCFANGEPAPIHMLEGLPQEWVAERDSQGFALRAIAEVVAGFLRDGRFYSREEAADLLAIT